MEDGSNSNSNNPSQGGGGQGQYVRVRRTSSSIISSTSMFQPPQNPASRHSRYQQQPEGEEESPASSSSTLRGRLSNGRPHSPLGSPDSTAYWGPSAPTNNAGHSYRAPLTPGGMCVVSSSTSDDIPASPFSPEEMGPPTPNNGPGQGGAEGRGHNQGQGQEEGESMAGPSGGFTPRRRPSLTLSGSSSLNLSSRSSGSGSAGQDLNHSQGQDNHNQPGPSSQSFSISPLRNKIKKASSFERFSLAAAITQNSSGINSSNLNVKAASSASQNLGSSVNPPNPNANVQSNLEPSISHQQQQPPNTNPTTQTTSSLGARGSPWDPSPSPEPNSLRSFTAEKSHIKIPSKKLAAKMAVYEQEKLARNASAYEQALVAAISKKLEKTLQNQNGQSSAASSSTSTLAQILNQSINASNSSAVNMGSIMGDEVVGQQQEEDQHQQQQFSREGEAPLNLTENTGNSTASVNVTSHSSSSNNNNLLPQRNPVISSRLAAAAASSVPSAPQKKIPLTPKQKLLQRVQTGELQIPSSISPPPPVVTISQTMQSSTSIPIQGIHQQPVVTLHQSVSETVQATTAAINHLVSAANAIPSGSGGNHSPHQHQPSLDPYSYDQLLRSARDVSDFPVQDSLGKVVEDPNVSMSNMLSVYDPSDAYYYSYPNILGDEIFANSGGNINVGGRQLLMMSGQLPDGMEVQGQGQGPLEFVLGFPNGVDDHQEGQERGGRAEEELQLQSLSSDPNDTLSAIKSSQSQGTESTLRNLLMMDTLRNAAGPGGGHPSGADESWLTLAPDYQSRLNLTDSRVRGQSSVGNLSSVSASGGLGGSWGTGGNEWSRAGVSSGWQGHEHDQDEVMDMSMMEHVKGSLPLSSHNQMKRMEEMDLTNGIPILSGMNVNVNMPLDLQQSISIMSHSGAGKELSMSVQMPIDLQHHRMDIDDEPVNLMAVNMDQDSGSSHMHHHSSHLAHSGSGGGSGHFQQEKGIQSGTSSSPYSIQISQGHQHHQHQQHSPELQGSIPSMGIPAGSVPDNIDERRIIRAKKNKESSMGDTMNGSNSSNSYQLSIEEHGQDHVNIIMDNPVEPKSIASLPAPFRISRISGNECGVFNKTGKGIPSNCRLGPVEGPLKKAELDIGNINAIYPSLVMSDGSDLWQLDRSDDEFCNWMKFVRLAHSMKDQNAVIVESEGYLYFMTCKEILPGGELQVGYSYEYAQKYGLPYLLPLPMDAFLEDGQGGQGRSNLVLSVKDSQQARVASPESPIQMQMPVSVIEEAQQGPDRGSPITIESYPCFECDQEFNLVEELQAHLNTHKEEDEEIEMIRKPKKKAMKKFHSAELQSAQIPAVASASSSSNVHVEKEEIQSQTMNADSSSTLEQEQSVHFGPQSSSPSLDIENQQQQQQQDNSVTTGTGVAAAPPKVKCTMCYKSFATKERLEKHMIVHSDEDTKPLKCTFCSKRFLTNSALAGHMKTHSEEGKFFECPVCIFSTPQLLQLKEHVQTHKSRDTGFFHCPKCPKKFTAYSMIRKHIRAFHGPRQFTCTQCPMSFPTSDKLKLHQLKHSDHREFLCAECGKQFKRKDKLREHTKRIHETKKKSIEINIPKDSKNSKKFIPKVAPEEYQKFPFKCQDCMVGFKRRGMLVNHLAKRHPDKKIKSVPELNQPILRLTRNYPCLYCDRVYKSSSKRKAHILKAHPGRPVPPQLRGTGNSGSSGQVEIPGSSSCVPVQENVVRGTLVQTVTEDGDPRTGIMNVSCNSSDLVSTSSQVLRKEANIVGKVAATPHGCQWCYREYATRAKLLQHQRKAHINLMPAEMQTPRTQKNNVLKTKKDGKVSNSGEASASNIKGKTGGHSTQGQGQQVIQSKMAGLEPLLIPDSTSVTSTSNSQIQTVAATVSAAEGFSEGNVIGYLLTTTPVSPSELGNLIPSELVMLGPVPNLGGGSAGGNGSILAPPNPNQNITIITKSSSSNV